jgi:hypothetical protein
VSLCVLLLYAFLSFTLPITLLSSKNQEEDLQNYTELISEWRSLCLKLAFLDLSWIAHSEDMLIQTSVILHQCFISYSSNSAEKAWYP